MMFFYFLWSWRPKCGRIMIKDALILFYADITENGCGFVYLAKSRYVSIANAYKNIDTSLKSMSFLVLYELGLSQWQCIEIYVKCWLHFFLSVMKSFVFICGKWTLNKCYQFYAEFQAHAVLYGISTSFQWFFDRVHLHIRSIVVIFVSSQKRPHQRCWDDWNREKEFLFELQPFVYQNIGQSLIVVLSIRWIHFHCELKTSSAGEMYSCPNLS